MMCMKIKRTKEGSGSHARETPDKLKDHQSERTPLLHEEAPNIKKFNKLRNVCYSY